MHVFIIIFLSSLLLYAMGSLLLNTSLVTRKIWRETDYNSMPPKEVTINHRQMGGRQAGKHKVVK